MAHRALGTGPHRTDEGGTDMGGALPLIVILLVVAAAIALLSFFVVVPWARKEIRHTDELVEEDTPALEYRVPPGQDPAAVVAALRLDGIDAVTALRNGEQRVVIACPSGPDRLRARARAVIAHESSMNLGDDTGPAETRVRFADE